MPYAALNRPGYEGFRSGDYRSVALHIVEAWSFDETVQPLFPVPASVFIGKREAALGLPKTVERYSGSLPRRDASEAEADKALRHSSAPWPPMPSLQAASPYRSRFKQGATLVPRRFFVVEREAVGQLGGNPDAPRIRGKIGPLDKRPWSTSRTAKWPSRSRVPAADLVWRKHRALPHLRCADLRRSRTRSGSPRQPVSSRWWVSPSRRLAARL